MIHILTGFSGNARILIFTNTAVANTNYGVSSGGTTTVYYYWYADFNVSFIATSDFTVKIDLFVNSTWQNGYTEVYTASQSNITYSKRATGPSQTGSLGPRPSQARISLEIGGVSQHSLTISI